MVLETEISAFERRRDELEKHHSGKFVVFYGDEMVGAFDTFDAAARVAVSRFGRGPYLIRQIGAPPAIMPASVMYRPVTNVANR